MCLYLCDNTYLKYLFFFCLWFLSFARKLCIGWWFFRPFYRRHVDGKDENLPLNLHVLPTLLVSTWGNCMWNNNNNIMLISCCKLLYNIGWHWRLHENILLEPWMISTNIIFMAQAVYFHTTRNIIAIQYYISNGIFVGLGKRRHDQHLTICT